MLRDSHHWSIAQPAFSRELSLASSHWSFDAFSRDYYYASVHQGRLEPLSVSPDYTPLPLQHEPRPVRSFFSTCVPFLQGARLLSCLPLIAASDYCPHGKVLDLRPSGIACSIDVAEEAYACLVCRHIIVTCSSNSFFLLSQSCHGCIPRNPTLTSTSCWGICHTGDPTQWTDLNHSCHRVTCPEAQNSSTGFHVHVTATRRTLAAPNFDGKFVELGIFEDGC